MKPVVINNFTGGLAEDVREQKGNTFSNTKNFDTTSYSNRIVPFAETEAEALGTGDITDSLISDFVRDTSGYIYAVGRTSSGTPTGTTFFIKSSATNIASTYSIHASTGGGTTFRPNSATQFLDGFYFIDSNHNLKKMTFPTTFSTVGTIDMTSSWTGELIPRPFVHPLRKYLYASVGQYFARVNDSGTYLDLTSLVLPASQYTSSLTDYGNWLAIGTAPSFTGGRSIVYLWDMAEDRTFNEAIDWGEGSLMVLENLNGTLVGVSISDTNYSNVSTYTTTQKKKLTVRALSGGQAVVVKQYEVASNFSLKNFKATVNGKLYFGGDNDDSLYVVYKDRNGQIVVSKDRYMANGTTVTTLRGFAIFGDYLFIGYDTAGSTGNVYRTKVTPGYTFSSYYETTVNPNMELGDRTKKKQLQAISVSKGSTTGTMTLQYSVDGSAYTSIGTTLGGLVNKMTNDYLSNPFEAGYEYKFRALSDSGAEITEIKYSYDVIEELI